MQIIQPISSHAAWSCKRCNNPLHPGSNFCQICGAPTRPAARAGLRIALRTFLILNGLSTLVALALIAFHVETVLGTGPITLAIGIATIIIAALMRYARGVVLGGLNCFIVILFFTMVMINSWGPDAARKPFMLLGVLYNALTIPLTIWYTLAIPRTYKFDPNRCESCGYLLQGLAHARCPECGTPFDPAQINSNAR